MDKIKVALIGLAMGIAEAIPGVSGGTIAFISGIYERLIAAISRFSPSLIKEYKQRSLGSFLMYLDVPFLASLAVGMGIGVVGSVFTIHHLLEKYPAPLWAFFFGLILASAVYIARKIKIWNLKHMALLVIGFVIAYGITTLSPASGNESLPFVFITGALAISALILPGISGSFIMLLLGMYTYITGLLKGFLETFDTSFILPIVVFMAGCLTGLLLFARVLKYTFANYRFPTLALLTGFILGSLNKIWPWRNASLWLNEQGEILTSAAGSIGEELKIIKELNVAPSSYNGDPMIAYVIGAFIFGLIMVWLLSKFDTEEI